MKTVLVTGANRGIGLALTQQCVDQGDTVIAVCRRRSPELDVVGAKVESDIDITDDGALVDLAQRLGTTNIDILILNAGILGKEVFGKIGDAEFSSIRRQFEVNALGPLRVTQTLRGNLKRGSKIAIVTSRMGSVADNESGGYYGYRASKCAVNAIGKSLALDLEAQGIAVFLLHPGYVSTDMVGGTGDISPKQSAAQLLERITSLGLADTGSFWHANGAPLPW